MNRIRWSITETLIIGIAFLLSATPVKSQNPYTSAADVAEGRRTFELDCAQCHGGDARGGLGPDLTRGTFRYASTDDQLREVLREGIDGTAMTGLRGGRNTDQRAWKVVAYLRSLSGGGEIPPGDSQRGRELFFGSANCSTCHIVAGEGTTQGPDLTLIGYRRSVEFLRTSVLDPNAEVDPRWWSAQLTTIAGTNASGYLLGEDIQSVRLLDINNRLLSFPKAQLEQFEPVKTSRMPSYEGLLGDDDIDNIIAYLAGLRGEGADQ